VVKSFELAKGMPVRHVLAEAMSDLQIIESALQQAARRCRLARAMRGAWHGVLVGSIVALLLIGLWHVRPLPLWTLTLAAFAPFPCALAGMIIAGWRKPALPEVARWVDGRQHLQERLSTALEVASDAEASTWRELVVSDAAEHAKEVDPRRLVPFHLPKATRWALVVLALGAGLGFVPEYRSKSYLQKKADERIIKEAGRQLADLTRRSLEKRPPALEPTQKALEAVTDLGDKLTKQTLTRSEALRDLASVAEKLKQELKELGKDPALRRMEQAARASASRDSQTAAGLQKQIEALQKQIGTPVGNPEALDQLKKDLEKLQEAAKSMTAQQSPGNEAERQKLSEALSALSKQMQDAGLQLPQLDEAIEALAADQPGLVLKDLEAAVTDLEKMRDMAKQLQQLQQQAQKLGKDLAEQLKNGQPEAAQATLQKMVTQLKSANLTPEQLQKILQEVSKAVEPAGNYGKVAEHLENATRQMQAGEKPAAAQSLAAAAKELGDLMQQMGDAEALMATLENLDQASMCIGAGQRWGSQTANRPGYNPYGAGPGGGVGTWADPNAEWDGRWSDHWDNTGVARPDQDARGQTDRGEGELSDALQPTKVKGRFSPGGQMPSITLKGVSIKGQSRVAYEEAVTAAQSDAQSALSQDKVPRAYQGAVKDYFDDLKK
jgi:predicted  nucleic acid-binding Zn-ribbon protein